MANENKSSFIIKLAKVQSELKAPKSQYNSFGNYKYRSCEDIVESVKPLLAKQGLALVITDDIELVGERYYVKATATITDGENEVHSTAYAREPLDKKGMDESQITGASSSYARKYALNGLLAIDDTKDADSLNTSKDYTEKTHNAPNRARNTSNSTISAKPLDLLKDYENALSQDKMASFHNWLKDKYGTMIITELTEEQANEVCKIVKISK